MWLSPGPEPSVGHHPEPSHLDGLVLLDLGRMRARGRSHLHRANLPGDDLPGLLLGPFRRGRALIKAGPCFLGSGRIPTGQDPPTCSQPDSDDEAEEIQWSDDENTTTLTAPEFPEFTTQVQEAIDSLGGSVFPKLNWSAPRDAYWIAMNSSLKCKTLSDIFLLFKSSDFITRDFTQPFIHCTDDSPDPCIEYELVLRKWCELIPGAEFRCFVKENKLIGISQRDYTQYYDHISKRKEEICRCIQDFFRKHIQYKFLDEDFVFDIYRDSRGKVWLIDFNPFGEVTDSLLFTWEELISEKNLKGDFSEGDAQEQDSPAFRCTNSEVTVQPSPYLSYQLPKDFVDLSTGEDAHKLIDFLKLKRNQQEDD
ncbi:Cell division cycle protein 123-like protein [Heterocephalus glaber]|uniref:Translation initiation factor eIF2 assembly protein n=1 Tax=Heterocephalus glaber TaxID=10181 RepID=G5BE24_HETGA|nr:Cell division cycle protein 123-like protein [Heterocephalus glaber]